MELEIGEGKPVRFFGSSASARFFKKRSLEREKLERLFEIACYAPSDGNLQLVE
jgi:nitroreductase